MIYKDDDKVKVFLNKFSGRFYQKTLELDDEDFVKLDEHFSNGGSFSLRIVGALLGCSHMSVKRMLDKNETGDVYNAEFATFIEMCKNKAILKTDVNHNDHATGKLKGDSTSMNRRASAILKMNETQVIETKHSFEALTNDEIEAKFDILEEMEKQAK